MAPDTIQTNHSTFECELCQDTEFIIEQKPYYTYTDKDGNKRTAYSSVSTPCACREAKRYKRILDSSGISEAFQQKTVNQFKPKNKQQDEARKAAADYITNFEQIRSTRNNSIAFLGQVGAGKTHLTIAIANALLKMGIGVLYMQYREAVTQLKQCITDEESYQRELGKYKNAPVLLVDDLFKGLTRQGKANESELSIMFEIINFRYLKQMPVLVSSEFGIDRLIDFDEATGSRIADMCKGRTIEFAGAELNHRMV